MMRSRSIDVTIHEKDSWKTRSASLPLIARPETATAVRLLRSHRAQAYKVEIRISFDTDPLVTLTDSQYNLTIFTLNPVHLFLVRPEKPMVIKEKLYIPA
jgi:hypothetical protein